MPPLLANLDASCLDLDTSLHIIYFTVDDLQRLLNRRPVHASSFNGLEGKQQNALRKRLLENLELVFGLGKDDGLTDELCRDLLVVSCSAQRARLIGRAVQEQAARDDRRVALAVSADLDTPWLTRCQRLVGEPGFVKLLAGPPVSADGGLRDDDDAVQLISGKGRSAIMGTKRFECVCCTDSFKPEEVLRAPCQHYYCRTCVTSLVKACTKDESLFPIKCCKKPITATTIRSHLENDDLRDRFSLKVIEYNTPTTRRVYCPKTRCSAFMGSLPSSSSMREMSCQKCHSQACGICRGPAHVGKDCPNDKGCLEVREMAKMAGWQTCPNCKAVIQKVYGCNSMVCSCRANFCYGCGMMMTVCRGSCAKSGGY